MGVSVRFDIFDYLFFLFHARLLTRIFPYGRILAGQVGAFALFPLTIQIFRKREDKYALYNNFGW